MEEVLGDEIRPENDPFDLNSGEAIADDFQQIMRSVNYTTMSIIF